MTTITETYRERTITVTAVAKEESRFGWRYLIDGADPHDCGRRTLPSERVALAEGLNAALAQIDDDFFREFRTS